MFGGLAFRRLDLANLYASPSSKSRQLEQAVQMANEFGIAKGQAHAADSPLCTKDPS